MLDNYSIIKIYLGDRSRPQAQSQFIESLHNSTVITVHMLGATNKLILKLQFSLPGSTVPLKNIVNNLYFTCNAT